MKRFFLTMCLFLLPVTAAIAETNHFNTKYDYNNNYNPSDYRLDLEDWLKEKNIKKEDVGVSGEEIPEYTYPAAWQVEANCGGIPTVGFRPSFETTTEDRGRSLSLTVVLKPAPSSYTDGTTAQLKVKTSKTTSFMMHCFPRQDLIGCLGDVNTFIPSSPYNEDPRDLMNAEQISLEVGGDQIVLFKKGTCEGIRSAFDGSITDYLEFIDLFAKHKLVPVY